LTSVDPHDNNATSTHYNFNTLLSVKIQYKDNECSRMNNEH